MNDVLSDVVKGYGAIDVLVNNAGYGLWGPVESLLMEDLKTQFEINFFASFCLMQVVLSGMLRRGKGTTVNISSILGRIGTPLNGGYAASNFAREGLSESLRTEVLPFGVRVALVELGFFRTNFQHNQVFADQLGNRGLRYQEYVQRHKSRHRLVEYLSGDPLKVACDGLTYAIRLGRRSGLEAWLLG